MSMRNLRYTSFLFMGLLIICIFLIAHLFWGFITPIVLALVLVSIFSPAYHKFYSLFGQRKYPAALVVTILVLLCVLIPSILLITALSSQALYLYENTLTNDIINDIIRYISQPSSFTDFIQKIAPKLGYADPIQHLSQNAGRVTQFVGLVIYDNLSNIASNLIIIAFNFILTLILVFTLLVTGNSLKIYLMNLIPLPEAEKERIIIRFRDIAKAVFVGNGIVSVAEGILGGLGMLIFGVGPAIFWGAMMWFVAFLPIGVSVIFIPATVVLVINGRPAVAIGYFVYNAVYAVLLEAFVKPQLIGGKNRMHAVLVFLTVLGGLQVYGLLGIFYGPLILTMFLTLGEIYQDHYRADLFGEGLK